MSFDEMNFISDAHKNSYYTGKNKFARYNDYYCVMHSFIFQLLNRAFVSKYFYIEEVIYVTCVQCIRIKVN